MIDYFLFLSFIFLFMLSGRGLLIILNYFLDNKFLIDNEEIFGIKLFYYYPIIGLFSIGNFLVIYNFISPINYEFFLFFILLLLPNFIKKIQLKILKSFVLKISFISIPILIGYSNIGLHYDAGLYHLNHQSIFRENKIIFGLSNLYDHYGFSSIIEYLHAMSWFNENLYFIKYFQMIFFVFLFLFLLENIISSKIIMAKNIAFLTSFYIFLDNFGIGGGLNGTPNIQGVTKFDSIFSIIFYIAVFMYFIVSKNISYVPNEYRILFLFVLFSTQIRPTGIVLFILLLSMTLKSGAGIKKIFHHNLILIVTFFIWIIKNVISTGCIFFPIAISCLDTFRWSSKQTAVNLTNSSKNYFINSQYEQELSLQLVQNVFISLFIIFLIILFLKIKQETPVNFDISFIIFSFVNIYIFINFLPNSRFFGGFYMSLIPGLYCLLATKNKFIFSKKITISFLTSSLILIPLISQYNSYQPFDTSALVLKPVKTEYIKYKDSTFITPKVGDTCWINPNCIPNQTYPNKISFFNYTMFVK
jgi:hypothetical protein